MKYEIHPVAEIFPKPTKERYQEIYQSIEKYGQLVPIVLYKGKVIDGRTRLQICEELGVEPKCIEVSGETNDPVGYGVALNMGRRDLTPEDRIIICGKAEGLWKELEDQAHAAKVEGNKKGGVASGTVRRGEGKSPATSPTTSPTETAYDSRKKLAETFKISQHGVTYGKQIVAAKDLELERMVRDKEVTPEVGAIIAKMAPEKREEAKKNPAEVVTNRKSRGKGATLSGTPVIENSPPVHRNGKVPTRKWVMLACSITKLLDRIPRDHRDRPRVLEVVGKWVKLPPDHQDRTEAIQVITDWIKRNP